MVKNVSGWAAMSASFSSTPSTQTTSTSPSSRMRANSLSFTRKPGVPYDGFSVVAGSDRAIRRTSSSVTMPP